MSRYSLQTKDSENMWTMRRLMIFYCLSQNIAILKSDWWMLHRTFMRLNFVILILNLLLHLNYSKISIYMLENQEWYISLVYKVLYWFRIKLFLSFLTCCICHFETRFLNTEYRKYTKGENMRKVRLIHIFPNISGLGFNINELKQKHYCYCRL